VLRLSDQHWARIREHFPEEHIPAGRARRKPIPARPVLEAVLWILNTGVHWHMQPQCYPNYKTGHRRFQHRRRNEVLRDAMTDLANTLRNEVALENRTALSTPPLPRPRVAEMKSGRPSVVTI
jgi:transposase